MSDLIELARMWADEIDEILERVEEGMTTVEDARRLRIFLGNILPWPGLTRGKVEGEQDAFPEPEGPGHDLLPA